MQLLGKMYLQWTIIGVGCGVKEWLWWGGEGSVDAIGGITNNLKLGLE